MRYEGVEGGFGGWDVYGCGCGGGGCVVVAHWVWAACDGGQRQFSGSEGKRDECCGVWDGGVAVVEGDDFFHVVGGVDPRAGVVGTWCVHGC